MFKGYLGVGKMNGIELLGSFVKGFNKSDMSDIVNGVYIAKSVFKIRFPFYFTDRGTRGVDSVEIRKIVLFSKMEDVRNHEKPFKAAKRLSKFDSKKLAWVAQFIMNGETHLYEEEMREASKIKAKLSQIKL